MINICEMDNGESIKGSKILSCLHESLTQIAERETVIKVFAPLPPKKNNWDKWIEHIIDQFLNVHISIPCSSEQENRKKKIESQIKGIKHRVPNFEFENKMKLIL